MEILSNLNKTTTKKAKRVGRGIGSGAGGHTTGRGAKGDKVRGNTKLTFDGTKIKKGWIKRLPFLRGKHRTLPFRRSLNFTLAQIDKWFKNGDTITPEKILKLSQTSRSLQSCPIKILAQGQLSKSLNFEKVYFSQAAKKLVITAGGNIK